MALPLRRLSGRSDLIALALMLEFLHLAIWVDFGGLFSRAFLLIHLGLFLLWQPVWRSDERISWQNTALFFILTLAAVFFLNWWLIFGWLILLSGFAGGRIVINRQERNTNLLVLLFLTLELVINCTPGLFRIPLPEDIKDLFGVMLPLLPLIIASLPVGGEKSTVQSVDILHAFSTSTLIGVLIFGSLLNMYLGGTDYLIALAYTLIAIGLFLFIISWLLSPKAGFSGLTQLWSRSLLNIGTPFEKWLADISNLSQQRQTPIEFLEAALEDLMTLPWIVGVKWQMEDTPGAFGDISKHETEFKTDNFTVSIYSGSWMGGALYLHCKLLIQLIDNFYLGKIRERQLSHQAHLKAIHETGARVTHDIKNLLQSLHAITSVIQYDQTDTESKSVSQRLLERQIPHFTQRLQLALDKLQIPSKEAREEVLLSDWWQDLLRRNDLQNIDFQSDISEDALVPVELFENTVENLLENLRRKTHTDTRLRISLTLCSNKDGIKLTVSDSGRKIPQVIARDLLREPVKSDSGLGIGLYQVTRLAQAAGYVFILKDNEDGNVSFELSSSRIQENIREAGRP